MGFTNFPPAVRVTPDGGIASVADATAQNPAGAIYGYTDSSGRWSVVRYYKAAASIALGAWLQKDTADRLPDVLITGTTDSGEVGKGTCKGIAAAAVSNTGYYSFCYIAGYCPDAAMPTLYASNQPMRLGATYAGRFASCTVDGTNNVSISQEVVLWSLGLGAVSTANSTNSWIISGWLM